VNDQRRRQRREIRLIQRESTWLQKALFALGKAEEAREGLSELRQETAKPLTVSLEGKAVPLEELEEALDSHIQELMETVRELRRTVR
jgi:hypothetical protein